MARRSKKAFPRVSALLASAGGIICLASIPLIVYGLKSARTTDTSHSIDVMVGALGGLLALAFSGMAAAILLLASTPEDAKVRNRRAETKGMFVTRR